MNTSMIKFLIALIIVMALAINLSATPIKEDDEDLMPTYGSLRGASRFLARHSRGLRLQKCNKNPRRCRARGSPGNLAIMVESSIGDQKLRGEIGEAATARKPASIEFIRISLARFRSCTSRSRYQSVSKQTTRHLPRACLMLAQAGFPFITVFTKEYHCECSGNYHKDNA
ncbi:hypothetical protein Tco_1071132 [Tanacetum coccineum]|uniref:Uncharacterized protein n=1 Tax=Tanacetum coccineum TaxID=301880 RepID=A0ABQ5HQ56_9ASTR